MHNHDHAQAQPSASTSGSSSSSSSEGSEESEEDGDEIGQEREAEIPHPVQRRGVQERDYTWAVSFFKARVFSWHGQFHAWCLRCPALGSSDLLCLIRENICIPASKHKQLNV